MLASIVLAAWAASVWRGQVVQRLEDRLQGAAGEQVFAEIEQALDRFRGPNGLEVPGEALIGVGAR